MAIITMAPARAAIGMAGRRRHSHGNGELVSVLANLISQTLEFLNPYKGGTPR